MRLLLGDCLEVLPTLEEGSVDAVVTDPPYGLSFMGRDWDSFGGRSNKNAARDRAAAHQGPGAGNGNQPFGYSGSAIWGAAERNAFAAFSAAWAAAALRVVKPGGYLLAFGGTRTFHRLACAIEDAGWEIRDTLCWLYGSGFPKGKGCLKPAWESILLARRPGPRVLPLGVDECRVPTAEAWSCRGSIPQISPREGDYLRDGNRYGDPVQRQSHPAGRWPANVCHDGSDEVLEAFAAFGESKGGTFRVNEEDEVTGENVHEGYKRPGRSCLTHKVAGQVRQFGDTGTAARFFFTAKAPPAERLAASDGTRHPTQKPLALMRWLVKLVCPPGGTVLDPFLGSGTTAVACLQEGRECVGVEREASYMEIVHKRLAAEEAKCPLFAGKEGA